MQTRLSASNYILLSQDARGITYHQGEDEGSWQWYSIVHYQKRNLY